jgi:hypothetical protein
MAVQVQTATGIAAKLNVTWDYLVSCRAVSLQIAADSEFTERVRTFVLPPEAAAATLDVGGIGSWYVRCGGWIGGEREGVIQWSGIRGPVPVLSTQPVVPVPAPGAKLEVLHTQSLVGGLRIHTGLMMPYYAVLEYSREERFLASQTKSQYTYDLGLGHVECTGLPSEHVHSVRATLFTEDLGNLPKTSIKQLGGPWKTVRRVQSMRPPVAKNNTDKAVYAAQAAVLQDRKERPNMRFNSYAEYMEYLAAKERTTSSAMRRGA